MSWQPIDAEGIVRARLAAWPLTPRERALLGLMLIGHTRHAAARALGISDNTAKRLLQTAYPRLKVRSTGEALARLLGTVPGREGIGHDLYR